MDDSAIYQDKEDRVSGTVLGKGNYSKKRCAHAQHAAEPGKPVAAEEEGEIWGSPAFGEATDLICVRLRRDHKGCTSSSWGQRRKQIRNDYRIQRNVPWKPGRERFWPPVLKLQTNWRDGNASCLVG